MYNFNPERLEIVTVDIALSRLCLKESLKWAIQRDSFGKKLHDH
jgi:alkylation response protein AidB-like acyl-CoA dehydrogenase